jgi:hypothetical protein
MYCSKSLVHDMLEHPEQTCVEILLQLYHVVALSCTENYHVENDNYFYFPEKGIPSSSL